MIWTFHVLSLKTEKTRRTRTRVTNIRKTEALVLKSTEAQPNLTPFLTGALTRLLKQSLTLFARGKHWLGPTKAASSHRRAVAQRLFTFADVPHSIHHFADAACNDIQRKSRQQRRKSDFASHFRGFLATVPQPLRVTFPGGEPALPCLATLLLCLTARVRRLQPVALSQGPTA